MLKNSPVYGLYDEGKDRESAYQLLEKRADERAKAAEEAAKAEAEAKAAKSKSRSSRSGYKRQSATERFVKNMASSVGRQLGTAIVRGLLGGLLRR